MLDKFQKHSQLESVGRSVYCEVGNGQKLNK